MPSHSGGPVPSEAFFSRSLATRHLFRQIERYAQFDDAVVLLEGESGTGKTVLARHMHGRSARARNVFREVSLATLDDTLAASDLFGHVRGAFTDARTNRAGHFREAHGGTLFLDEIGKASPAVQKKLLGVIETGEFRPVGADVAVRVNVRVMAATNTPLTSLVASGAFLPDLFARISAFRVCLPPLRERSDDIPALVEFFVARNAPRCGYEDRVPELEARLVDALSRADWPYNLRQLDGTIARLLVEAEGADIVSLEHCTTDLAYLGKLLADRAEKLTPELVAEAVGKQASIAAAARKLGVARTTVYRYMNQVRKTSASDSGTAAAS